MKRKTFDEENPKTIPVQPASPRLAYFTRVSASKASPLEKMGLRRNKNHSIGFRLANFGVIPSCAASARLRQRTQYAIKSARGVRSPISEGGATLNARGKNTDLQKIHHTALGGLTGSRSQPSDKLVTNTKPAHQTARKSELREPTPRISQHFPFSQEFPPANSEQRRKRRTVRPTASPRVSPDERRQLHCSQAATVSHRLTGSCTSHRQLSGSSAAALMAVICI